MLDRCYRSIKPGLGYAKFIGGLDVDMTQVVYAPSVLVKKGFAHSLIDTGAQIQCAPPLTI